MHEIDKDTLYEFPYKCNHPYEELVIDTIIFNSRMAGIVITFRCKRCNGSLRGYKEIVANE